MMTEKEIVKKLVGTYPNSIVPIALNYGGCAVDFVSTVDNFAADIMRDFDAGRQKYYFNIVFENVEDCARYIARYLHDLEEACQTFVDETYDVDTDGEICYLGEED